MNRTLIDIYNDRQLMTNALRLVICDLFEGTVNDRFIKTCMEGYVARAMLPENQYYKLRKIQKENKDG